MHCRCTGRISALSNFLRRLTDENHNSNPVWGLCFHKHDISGSAATVHHVHDFHDSSSLYMSGLRVTLVWVLSCHSLLFGLNGQRFKLLPWNVLVSFVSAALLPAQLPRVWFIVHLLGRLSLAMCAPSIRCNNCRCSFCGSPTMDGHWPPIFLCGVICAQIFLRLQMYLKGWQWLKLVVSNITLNP
jgi:hypothetical protein